MRGSQRLKKKHFGDLVFDQRESGQRRKILGILNSLESPVPLEKLFVKLRPSPSYSLESLAKELSLMKDDCLIIETSPEEGFRIFRETEELSGTVSVHSDGYGFVKTDCGTPDIYLSRRETKGLFDTDRVLVRVFRKRDRAKLSGR
ncbi:MAG: hypothetical protein VX986_04200, partial [Pseudomonadota bacterium]|nr:hypothetical protein [Pseudomonadota bacterium]